jgi:type I restriction enzyme S subunit
MPVLPETWAWATIDQVAAEDENAITDGPFGANLKTAHYVQTPGYRVIRLQNVGRGRFRAEHRSFIDKGRFDRLKKHWVFAGDLVVAGLVDPLVRCCEVPDDIGPALVKADCYRFKVHPNFSSRFALHYLNSPVSQRFASVHHHGMTLIRIGLGNFRRMPVPVPPLAEQHRIVAKVDELMAVSDRLEAQLSVSQTERGRLLESVLHEALAGRASVDARAMVTD